MKQRQPLASWPMCSISGSKTVLRRIGVVVENMPDRLEAHDEFAWRVAARPVSETVVMSDDCRKTYASVAVDARATARRRGAEAMHCAMQRS